MPKVDKLIQRLHNKVKTDSSVSRYNDEIIIEKLQNLTDNLNPVIISNDEYKHHIFSGFFPFIRDGDRMNNLLYRKPQMFSYDKVKSSLLYVGIDTTLEQKISQFFFSHPNTTICDSGLERNEINIIYEKGIVQINTHDFFTIPIHDNSFSLVNSILGYCDKLNTFFRKTVNADTIRALHLCEFESRSVILDSVTYDRCGSKEKFTVKGNAKTNRTGDNHVKEMIHEVIRSDSLCFSHRIIFCTESLFTKIGSRGSIHRRMCSAG